MAGAWKCICLEPHIATFLLQNSQDKSHHSAFQLSLSVPTGSNAKDGPINRDVSVSVHRDQQTYLSSDQQGNTLETKPPDYLSILREDLTPKSSSVTKSVLPPVSTAQYASFDPISSVTNHHLLREWSSSLQSIDTSFSATSANSVGTEYSSTTTLSAVSFMTSTGTTPKIEKTNTG
jgi:hypothetical protein